MENRSTLFDLVATPARDDFGALVAGQIAIKPQTDAGRRAIRAEDPAIASVHYFESIGVLKLQNLKAEGLKVFFMDLPYAARLNRD